MDRTELPDGLTVDEEDGTLRDSVGQEVKVCESCGGILTPAGLEIHVRQAHSARG